MPHHQSSTRSEIDGLNARIDRLPGFPLSGAVRVVLALLYFFAFYDITVIGVALPTIAKDLDLSTAELSIPVTTNLVGYVVGAYLFSTLADYLGRRRALIFTLSVLSIGGLLTGFSWNVGSLSGFRFIVGIGTGALISLGSTYVSEVMPARTRGRLTQVNMFWAGVGLGVAPWIALPLLGLSGAGWRILLALGTLAIVPIVLIRYLPESPRWLAATGRSDAAEDVVAGMESRVLRTSKLTALPAVPSLSGSEITESGFPTMTLLRRPYVSRILIVLAFWVAWYVASYGVLGYEPTLLANMGLSEPKSVLLTAIGDIAFPVGALLAYFFIDRIERRTAIALISGVFTVALVLFAIGSSVGIIIAAGLLFSLTIVPGAAAGYTYTSEIFPTHARASAMSLGDGLGHLGGVFAPAITLAALAAWGGHGSFWLLAAFGFVGFLVIAVGGIRETTGRSLIQVADDAPDKAPAAETPAEPNVQ
jgi:putative MFS transporter